MSAEALPVRRRSRIGLYAPFLLLALLVVCWSVGWFVIREKMRAGLDEWVSQEAAAGRRWSCADRSFGGYPFRIEVGCSDFTIDRPDVHASLGRLLVVAQVYRPRHIIAEVAGPLRIEAGPTRAEGRWRLLQASVITSDQGLDRISIVTDEPSVTVRTLDGTPFDLASRRFEAHLRPDPADRTKADLAVRSDGAIIPGLDELVGGAEAADIAAGLEVTEADDLPARPLWSELERWRLAGGRAVLTGLTMTKGARRLEGKGSVGIDAQHRPEGQLDLASVALGGLLGRVASGAGMLETLLGGGPAKTAPVPTSGVPLRPLPQLRLQDGRLLVGRLPVPGVRIPPLY